MSVCTACRLLGSVSTVFILLTVLAVVDCGSVFKLKMISFSNPSNRLWDGSKCDIFNGKCDPNFRFSLDTGNSNDDAKGSHYWAYQSGTFGNTKSITFGSNIRGVSNPIVWIYPQWPGAVKFKVYVEDEDIAFHDRLDSFVYRLQLTPARNESLASWTTVVAYGQRSSDKTSLRFSYMLYCQANYYSADCSVRCVPQNSASLGHYTCHPATGARVCRSGYEDPSTLCNRLSNDCVGHRCLNGATCVDGYRSYTCRCLAGFTGTYCQINVNECSSNPCLNNGTCTDLVAGYRCTCTAEFVGPRCAQHRCHASNPCHHGGTCYGAGLCFCPAGYTGHDCSTDLCDLVSCKNGGSCVSGTCVCSPGFTGATCDVNLCGLILCQNGGSCSNGSCECQPGFTGRFCEVNINDCIGDPCDNNGTCYDLDDGFRCSCLPGFVGHRCSDVVNNTASSTVNDQSGIEIWLIVTVCVCLILLMLIFVIVLVVCLRHRRRKRQDNAPQAPETNHYEYPDVFAVSNGNDYAAKEYTELDEKDNEKHTYTTIPETKRSRPLPKPPVAGKGCRTETTYA